MKYIEHKFPWTDNDLWAWADEDALGRLPSSLLGDIDSVDDIDSIMFHVNSRTDPSHGGKTWEARTCIQAGAACGIWPCRLSQLFKYVISAEPIPANYEAAISNVRSMGPGNVRMFNMGLGETDDECFRMTRPKSEQYNCGAWHVNPDVDDDFGDLRMTTIDSITRTTDCVDLIALDLEGYEMFALRGGAKTIASNLPVIYFEDKGHGRKFNVTPGKIQQYLHNTFGYSVAEELKNNTIMTAK